ncbi:unnamed protein product [Brassicogethes aeneus]|uniref:C2H2-type domain-containing protein n=1 Tax=Brassicogethes aeneus TaxID=1431903 RepID=A0A9P0FBM5_BRAAE|nr:unnamed protein product [Brassicogethes aeneus]
MEQIVVKNEPEELIDDFKGDISMSYDKPSTSAEQEMPTTSEIAIKQEIKEDLDDIDNFMEYVEAGVKEESLTFTDEEYNLDEPELVELKFEAEDEVFLDKGTDTEGEKEIRKNGKGKLFYCDICPKKFKRNSSLSKHVKYVHQKDDQEERKCDKCNYVTVRKDDFKAHLKIHDKKYSLKCDFCDHTTARLYNLNAHILSKHKLKNNIKSTTKIHNCSKCSFSTVKKSTYDNHIKICLKLENVKWYECLFCPYKTIRNYDLNKHLKTKHKDN